MSTKFKLKTIKTLDFDYVIENFPILESELRLKDWIVINVRDYCSPEQIDNLREHLKNTFGEKVILLCGDIEFCEFEEII